MNSFKQLSDPQQIALSLLPIPSAIISILGSCAVIYLAGQRRKVKPWTPYHRLLVAMSVCDILLSSSIGIGTFLRPKETSNRIWAFGNVTTCNFIAFMNQATSAGIWYQGMLSIYFWLTARYGMKNETISKCIEPLMHFFALGYSIGTAILGAVWGIYGEKTGGGSCWVARYYDESVPVAERNKRDFLLFLFMPIPMVAVTLCLIGTQTSIYLFVRQHTQKILSPEDSDESSSSSNNVDALGFSERTMPADSTVGSSARTSTAKKSSSNVDALGFSERTMPADSAGSERGGSSARTSKAKKSSSSDERKSKQGIAATKLASQSQRLQLVCSQAFLYVFSFIFWQAWNIIMAVLQNKAQTQEEEMETIVNYYPLAVVQAMLLPIQGLFTFLIYIRPKYLLLRLEFPSEERLWTIRRIFLGNKLPPTYTGGMRFASRVGVAVGRKHSELKSGGGTSVGDAHQSARSGMPPPARPPRSMISSVSASDGDFDSHIDILGEDERWQDASNHVQQSTPADLASGVSRLTKLEAISEMSQSVFELSPYQANGSHLSNSSTLSIPTSESEDRWKDEAPRPTLDSSSEERFDIGLDTEHRRYSGTDSKPELPRRRYGPNQVPTQDVSKVSDVPIRVPRRTSDAKKDDPPEMDSTGDKNSNIGPRAKRASDVPLALPQRFQSLPPSEIEDV